jgi:hypothetical protein
MKTTMAGLLMTALNGVLLLVWLWLDTGSGFVAVLFILGIFVGLAVFAGAAMEESRSRSRAE